ncbi:unnamed protein product [Acanthoscelides obtectus]|uniref:alpha-L-fucosidase n=1 Tax=Acanthoscelides obtectus TaxID=200917 RepID=A0A9P0MIS1_ACAOB|nr:unnamed protein product [Acanthoscelides obtectus]CAK1670356.1 Putative alpha-L-fucosidase [Acanthoscelides obtectus]
MKSSVGLSLVFSLCLSYISCVKYEPNWDSLDKRPLPKWFDEVKIGIFLHWSVFSVPSFGSEWFWEDWKSGKGPYVQLMKQNYAPNFKYQEFAKEFRAEFFDPRKWAKLFKKSGAKYVVLTSKHHEGYTLWPSTYSYGWNAKDVGPGRDLVGELSRAVRDENLTFGLYYSLYEWFNPMYLSDKQSNFTNNEFVEKKMLPEMHELVEKYKPAVIWTDGDWEAHDTYFKSTEFLAWLYNKSPVREDVVVNDRWGMGIPCKHGDFYTCTDRYNPGNLLMNIGPTKEGTITPIFEERLTQIGDWLSINGEAIYGTKPWTRQNDTNDGDVWYTSKGDVIYAILLKWKPTLELDAPLELYKQHYSCYLVGQEQQIPLTFTTAKDKAQITMPPLHTTKSKWAYVLKFQRAPQILRKNQ